jgi:hypothetical protein
MGAIARQECNRERPGRALYRSVSESTVRLHPAAEYRIVLNRTKVSQHPCKCELELGIFLMPQDILREAGSCRERCNSPERVPVCVVAVESTQSIREDSRRTGRLAFLLAVCDRRPVRRGHEIQLYHFGG